MVTSPGTSLLGSVVALFTAPPATHASFAQRLADTFDGRSARRAGVWAFAHLLLPSSFWFGRLPSLLATAGWRATIALAGKFCCQHYTASVAFFAAPLLALCLHSAAAQLLALPRCSVGFLALRPRTLADYLPSMSQPVYSRALHSADAILLVCLSMVSVAFFPSMPYGRRLYACMLHHTAAYGLTCKWFARWLFVIYLCCST